MPEPIVFRRLLLDGRFEMETVGALLRRLAQTDAPRPIVFEVTAAQDGVRWAIGTQDSLISSVRALTTDFLPGARIRPLAVGQRLDVDACRLLRLTRLPVSLDYERAEEITRALYSAFARARGDERLTIQVVLGRGHAPHLVSPAVTDPTIGVSTAVRFGTARPVPGRLRTRMEVRAALHSIEVTIRIGVNGGHPQRRRQLVMGVFGALRLLDTAGTKLRLENESAERFDSAIPARVRRSRLTTSELVPLLGLPLGESDLPGLPRHPRRPLPPDLLETHHNIFATASAPGDGRSIGLAPVSLLQHLVISGPTGSGKSTIISALAEQWIRAKRPIALLDPKRQLVDHLLARLPRSASDRVVVLDVADSARPVGFNPLDTAGRNADVVVDGILASLKAIFEDGWGPRTEDLLLAGLRSLSMAGEKRGEPRTLIDLPRLYTDAGFRRGVVGRVQHDPVLATFWAAFDDLSAGARSQMVAAPLNKLRKFLLRPNLVAVLGQTRPKFRVRDLFTGDHAVLVPLNESLIGPGSAQLLGSLLVAELFQAAQERAAESHPERRPGLVVIDEAQKFVHLPTALDDALATSRGYGVGWVAAHQYRSQLSPMLRAGFDTNARSKIIYANPTDDARDYARMARGLDAEDFMSLDKYEFYATLMHEGDQSVWFAARAMAPKPELGFADHIRRTSRERFGSPTPAPPATTASEADTDSPRTSRPGRKPRQV